MCRSFLLTVCPACGRRAVLRHGLIPSARGRVGVGCSSIDLLWSGSPRRHVPPLAPRRLRGPLRARTLPYVPRAAATAKPCPRTWPVRRAPMRLFAYADVRAGHGHISRTHRRDTR